MKGRGEKTKKKLIILIIVLVFSVFFNANPRTMSQPAGHIIVHGHYEYRDNNMSWRPTVWGRVRIYDVDPGGLQWLSDVNGANEWFTDVNGNFTSGPILNQDPEDGGGLDIQVWIYTWNWASAVTNGTYVYDFSVGCGADISDPRFCNLPDGYLGFSLRGVPNDQIGAWIIFSYHCGVTAGWDYLNQTETYETPMVICRWPYGNHSRYWTNGTIDLVDWACWWPDIILHEYGHHVMCSLYGYIPPSMEEHYMRLKSNSTTVWAEGWANFFPLAAFNKPTFILGINATHGIVYDLEAPHWCSPGWDDGDEVEGRVAGALWDIFDPTPDGYDTFSDGFTHIWHLLSTQTDNTFKEFWQEWTAHNESGTPGYPKQPALMAIFQNAIDYRGAGDVNGDCVVNMIDFQLVKSHIPSMKGEPDWDKRCDLNNDDVVNMLDYQIVKYNIGNIYDC